MSTFNHNDKFFVTSGGNIGVGVEAPNQDFHIKRDGSAPVIHLERINNNAGYLLLNGSINPSIAFDDGQNFRIATVSNSNFDGFSAKFTVKNNGNIGIGADDPSYKLQVQGNFYVNETAYINGTTTLDDHVTISSLANYKGIDLVATGASRPQVKFSNANQGLLGQIYGTENNALIVATGTGGNTALTLDSSQNATFEGNVTIAKSTPTLTFNNLAGGGLDPILEASGSNFNIKTTSVTPLSINLSTQAATFEGDIVVNGGDATIKKAAFPGGVLTLGREYSSSGDMTSALIQFQARNSNSTLRTFGKIEGRSNGYDGGSIYFYTENSGTETQALLIDENQKATFAGDVTINSVFPRIYLIDNNNNSDYSIINGNGTLRFYDDTNSADRLTISSSGNATFGGDITVQNSSSTHNSAINIKGYEPRLQITKTRGSSGDDVFRISHENDASAVDFSLSQNGGGFVRTARIGSTNRWVIGGYDEVNSAQLSVQGHLGVQGTVYITADGSNAVTLTESGAGLLTIATPDDFKIDCGSDITLDAAGNDIRFKKDNVEYGKFKSDSSNFAIYSSVENKDIIFRGNDGGTTIDALTLDMGEGGNAIFSGKISSEHIKYCSASISNSYVRVYFAAANTGQLATAVRLTGTSHGTAHVGNFTADILVNHYQDVVIKSQSGGYTQVTLKVESNNNGDYTLSVKSSSSNAATYYFKVEAISDNVDISTLPSSTSATNTTHEHTTVFGTNKTGEGGNIEHNVTGSLRVDDGNNYVKISEGSNSIGEIELKDSSPVFVQGWGTDFRVAVGTYNNHALTINSSKNATFAGTIASGNIAVTGGGGGNGQVDITRTSGASIRLQSQSALAKFGATTNHGLQFMTNDTGRWNIQADGDLVPVTSTYDIGSSGGHKPANVYTTNFYGDGIVRSRKNIVSNSTYNMMSLNSSRSIDDYGGLNKDYIKIDLVTPGPNTDGGSSAHGFGAFSLKLANNGANTNMTEVLNISAGANATFAGTVKGTTYLVNHTSASGIGGSLGDVNSAELGPGYLSLSRDDTADAKQIVFEKNDGEHSYLQTTADGLEIKGNGLHFSTDNTFLSNYNYTFRDAVGINNPNSLSAATSSTTAMAIGSKSGGNVNTSLITTAAVGIATAAPASVLHVHGTQNYGTIRVSPSGANGESAMAFFMDTAGTTTGTAWVVGHAGWGNTGDFVIGNQQYGGPIMLIQQDGKVGIGNTAPTRQLHLKNTSGDVRGIMVETTVANSYAEVQVKAASEFRIGTGGSGTSVANQFYVYDATNGAHRFDIAANGYVGIGNTSPDRPLHVKSNSDTPIMAESTDDTTGIIFKDNNSSNALYYRGNGNYFYTTSKFGIGTTSPDSKLEVITTGTNSVVELDNSTANYTITQYNAQGVTKGFSGFNTSFMVFGGESGTDTRLQAGGQYGLTVKNDTRNVGIGTTSPSSKLHVSGANTVGRFTSSSSYVDLIFENSSGTGGFLNFGGTTAFNVYVGGGSSSHHKLSLTNAGLLTVTGDVVAFGSPSDASLKENVKPIDNALDKVSKLKGVTFDWKQSDSILDIKEDIGFIAQDVREVLPELVRTNKDGKLSLRHKGIVPVLVEAIKELKAEIEELKCKCDGCTK